MKAEKIGGRWKIFRKEFEEWKQNRNFRLTTHSMEDYFKSFEFAIRVYYSGRSGTVEWATTKRRDLGEFIANQTAGKLGELAYAEFLRRSFNINIGLSFLLETEVAGQDIVSVTEAGSKTSKPSKIKISVKTTKMQNFNLWCNEKDIDNSDAYVLCRVELPQDQLLRIVRDHEKISPVRDLIPKTKEIQAEVAGFAWRDELKAKGASMEMIGANKKVVQKLRAMQFTMLSGELRKSRDDWKNLTDAL